MTGQHDAEADRQLKRSHRRIAVQAGTLALVMLGMAFAAVPLYRMFCQVTGFAGTTQRADQRSTTTLDKTVQIRFDSNTSAGLTWKFEPVKRTMVVKIGENRIAHFRAKNLSSETLVGTATFNVAPEAAGGYFNKLDCFCFTEQTLKPGESVDMPVSFFVDPAFAKERETRGISQITLSYTFFPVKAPEKRAGGTRSVAAKKGT